MRARLAIVVLVALPLAAADLAVKTALPTGPALYHHRSHAWVVLSAVLVVLALLAARLPSKLLAFAAGVLVAGLAGNLVSAARNADLVPNPFVAGRLAFNLADTFVLAGIALLSLAAMRLAVRHRHLLPQSTIPVRIVRHIRARRAARRSA
ncbi:MAG TPA: signal peptidase II [Gaiellaceae bacterium]